MLTLLLAAVTGTYSVGGEVRLPICNMYQQHLVGMFLPDCKSGPDTLTAMGP